MRNNNQEDRSYGDLVLICGDLHIPFRKDKIPDKFSIQLLPNRIQHVVCTGNVGNKDTYEWLKGLSNNFHCVKGEYDDISELQETKAFQIGMWKFVLIHGHQVVPWGDEEALAVYMKETDADICIHGHTQENRVSKIDRKYFINPGTLTGAYGPYKQDTVPSFTLLEMMGNELGIFTYKLINQEVIIEKVVITK